MILGISMTAIVSLGGFFATPLLMTYFFPDQIKEIRHADHIYHTSFDYHNYSEMTLPITSLGIFYRVFNCTKLQHPDPYFVGIFVTREGINKDEHSINDSIWKFHAYQGYEYNDWNVSMTFGAHTKVNPDIYIHHNYIAYEVTLFSQMILDALSITSAINELDLFPSLNYSESRKGTGDWLIPQNWEFSASIKFENATLIDINAHRDGWLESVRAHCELWGTTEEGIPYCVSSSGPRIYKDYGTIFDAFHQTFGNYARTHISWIK